MEYEKVLVAIDIHSDYEPVLEQALSLCINREQLQLLYVVEPLYFPETYIVGAVLDIQEKAQRHAGEVFANLQQEHRILPQNCRLERGNPSTLIHRLADEEGIELIVIGSHGKKGVQLLIGSTANAVLHGAKCDVLAVRVHDSE